MTDVDLSCNAWAIRNIFLALELASLNEEVVAQPLAGGVSSAIFRVSLRSGDYCLKQALPKLKVAKEWNVPVERVFAEIDYLQTVGHIVPGHVPRILGQDDASKSFVMEFLDPQFVNWKSQLLQGDIDSATARVVGDVMGRVHAATADDRQLARRFATDQTFHAIRLDPYLGETARMHPALAETLLAILERTAMTRRVLVHGDVSPKNILVGPNGPVLLDAECAWFGDPAFDIAFCLNHFLLKLVGAPDRGNALIASFKAFEQAYFARVTWEPAADLEQRVATLLPALALARIDGKSPVEYLDETQRAGVRHAAIPLIRGGPPSLDLVAAAWAREFKP